MGGSGRGSLSLNSLIVEEVLMSEEGRISRGILVINAVLTFFPGEKEGWDGKKFQVRKRYGLGMEPSCCQD